MDNLLTIQLFDNKYEHIFCIHFNYRMNSRAMWALLLLGLTVSSALPVSSEDDNYLNLFLVKVNKRSAIHDLAAEHGFTVADEVCNILVHECHWTNKMNLVNNIIILQIYQNYVFTHFSVQNILFKLCTIFSFVWLFKILSFDWLQLQIVLNFEWLQLYTIFSFDWLQLYTLISLIGCSCLQYSALIGFNCSQ